jgi:hypothetical protein
MMLKIRYLFFQNKRDMQRHRMDPIRQRNTVIRGYGFAALFHTVRYVTASVHVMRSCPNLHEELK